MLPFSVTSDQFCTSIVKRKVDMSGSLSAWDSALSWIWFLCHLSKVNIMKKTLLLISMLASLSVGGIASAANAPVNIAYPIHNSTVKNYFHSNFTTTCGGGMYTVKWYLDGTLVGNSTFYDVASVQFAHKLPAGWHSLLVVSSCGQDTVKFLVQ